MNVYQEELVRLITKLKSEAFEVGKRNPNLMPALYAKENSINDPETDRLVESFAYMMAQSNINFAANSDMMATNDLSGFLPEWFEPAVSSLILKAKIDNWDVWKHCKIKENTQFINYDLTSKKEILFSNDLPVSFSPVEICDSHFAFYENKFSAILKFKVAADFQNLNKIKIFFDYSKFSFFYRFLDELIFSKNSPEVYFNNNVHILKKDAVKYSFSEEIDKSIYSANNYTYYLHQFVNYMNNYCFINFDLSELSIKLRCGDEFKLVIPLSEYIKDLSEIKNFAHTNCFASKNYSVQRGDPIYLKCGQNPYLTLDKASKKNFIGIEDVQFFDQNHNDIFLIKGSDYFITKKYMHLNNKIDIIYYLKINNILEKDIIIVPYFKFSNLSDAHYIRVGSNLHLKRKSQFEFYSITSPTKTILYLDDFNSLHFYSQIFFINNNLMQENMSIKNIFDALNIFSDISLYYKGIISKIIYQFKIIEEKNEKYQIHNAYGCFHHKRYEVILEINKKIYGFGGVSLLVKFIETLLNKASKVNAKYTIQLKAI